MTKDDEREVQRKLRILQHAERIGHVAKTCHYFGIGRSSFYRWKRAYESGGEDGLVNAKTIPKNPPNQTPSEVAEKVLHCGVNIISGLNESCDIWRAITASNYPMQRYTGS